MEKSRKLSIKKKKKKKRLMTYSPEDSTYKFFLLISFKRYRILILQNRFSEISFKEITSVSTCKSMHNLINKVTFPKREEGKEKGREIERQREESQKEKERT